MSKNVMNIDDLEFDDWGHGEKYKARLGRISTHLGASQLGYNLTVLPPGKAAFPCHSHRVNEEMFFIVDGEGELRMGDERQPVRAGDVVCCPAGGPETAHQIRNTSDSETLRFLAVSTSRYPEIAEYPDSGKTGVLAMFRHNSGDKPTHIRLILKEGDGKTDYWEGE